jgi:osmotically inducible protein OsmC
MTRGIHVQLTPVYLYGAHIYRSTETIPASDIERVKSEAEENLQKIISESGINGHIEITPLVVIAEPFFRMRSAAQELICYAQDQRSDCILLNTHARKGVTRFLLGSFAEELTLQSELPILVINPNCDMDLKERIIFATDFSEESKNAFTQVIQLAKITRMPVSLFHQARYPLTPVVEYTLSPYPIYKTVPDEEIKKNRAIADEWAKRARNFGVQLTITFDEQQKHPADGILDFSAKNPGILAMAARSGRFEKIVLGSSTRRVLRQACLPTWIVHPTIEPDMAEKPNRKRRIGYAFWEGGLKSGHGRFSAESGGITSIPFSYGSRFSDQESLTPENLLGAAESACVAMAFAGELEKRALIAERIDVFSTVLLERSIYRWDIQSIDLEATVYIGVGNRVAIRDAFDSAIEKSLISKTLSVPINANLEVRSPAQVVNEGKRKLA